ncbi:MAG TPA: hypothetical protein VM778_09850, partial [Gemmatimonadota bacterium]|nr:hypothetical protein [Gemmatimonadota bacterium]
RSRLGRSPPVTDQRQRVERAVERSAERLRERAPSLAARVIPWTNARWPSGRAADYFLQPDRFPFLLLPEWARRTIGAEPDREFEQDLVHSSVNGYWFVRLLDDAMDEPDLVDPALLPALAFFHAEFQSPYHRWFASGHPFWEEFDAAWAGAADAVSADAGRRDVDRAEFEAVAARKMAAARIPLAAVLHRQGRLDLSPAWGDVCDRLARFEQLFDDVIDWSRDLRRGGSTWFLTEARRRSAPAESVTGWVAREGLEWGMSTLREWIADARTRAEEIGSADLIAHLERREAAAMERSDVLARGLLALRQIADHVPR